MELASLCTIMTLSKHPLLNKSRELQTAKGIILPGTAPLIFPQRKVGVSPLWEEVYDVVMMASPAVLASKEA